MFVDNRFNDSKKCHKYVFERIISVIVDRKSYAITIIKTFKKCIAFFFNKNIKIKQIYSTNNINKNISGK